MTIDQSIYFAIASGFCAGHLHLAIAEGRFIIAQDLANPHIRGLIEAGWALDRVRRWRMGILVATAAVLALVWPIVLFIRLHQVIFRRIGIRKHYVELVTCERCKTKHDRELHDPEDGDRPSP